MIHIIYQDAHVWEVWRSESDAYDRLADVRLRFPNFTWFIQSHRTRD